MNRKCTRLPGCIRLRNDLYCVGWGVKLYSLTQVGVCVCLCSFLVWFIRSLMPLDRLRFVRNHLKRGVRFADRAQSPDTAAVDTDRASAAVQRQDVVASFVNQYLRHDGVFLLRLIAHNTNGITTTEITRELWDLWYERPVLLHPGARKPCFLFGAPPCQWRI